jgi:DNA-directed RNA polymerase specialized sigma24 family protein
MSSQTQHYLDAIDPMASRFIRGKVRQLIRYRGFSPEDREDLFHDFAFDLLQRKEHFDPTAGTWEAFVIVVCENRFAALLEHRCAQKRSDRSEAGSLNDPVEVEGLTLSLGDPLPETQRFAHTRRSPRPPEEAADLQLDVASVIAIAATPSAGPVRTAETRHGVRRRPRHRRPPAERVRRDPRPARALRGRWDSGLSVIFPTPRTSLR